MTQREQRVINAFINCVTRGEQSSDYACLLIEDNQRYGWLSAEAKETFYTAIETPTISETVSEGVTETSENATEYALPQSEDIIEDVTL